MQKITVYLLYKRIGRWLFPFKLVIAIDDCVLTNVNGTLFLMLLTTLDIRAKTSKAIYPSVNFLFVYRNQIQFFVFY